MDIRNNLFRICPNRSKTFYLRARTMQIASQTSGIAQSKIVQSYSRCIKKTNSIQVYELERQSGPPIPPRKMNLETAIYNGGIKTVIEPDKPSVSPFTISISEPMIPNENNDDSHDHHGKQDWSKVQTHVWTLLVTIGIKSSIEGIAFVLTLQDSYAAGLAFLVAMIFKLFPLEPGYAIILSDAGLNHFYENLLSTLAVFPIYLGKFYSLENVAFCIIEIWEANKIIIILGAILGIILEDEFNAVKGYIFAALSGIFLYLSLSTLLPVLRNLMSESSLLASTGFRTRGLLRLLLALGGFLLAMVIIIPLVYFKNDMKYKFKTLKLGCMTTEYDD